MKASPRESLWRRISTHPAAEDEPPALDPSDEALWPGTLWTHPATASFAVEWLVVEHGHQHPEKYLLVPADSHPILGIRDISIPADELGGPLSIRCHLGRWVRPSILQGAQVSGRVDRQNLGRASVSFRTSCRQPRGDSLLDRDGGPSPSYEDWIAELELAWDALTSNLETPIQSQPTTGRIPAFAAFALVILGFGAGSLFYLDKSQRSRSDPWRQRFRRAGVQELSTMASLPPGISRFVLPPQNTLGPGRHQDIILPLDTEYVLLFVPLDSAPLLPEYRLTLHDMTRGLDTQQAQRVIVAQGAVGMQSSPEHAEADDRPDLPDLDSQKRTGTQDRGLYAILARTALSPGTLYRIHVEGYWAPSWVTICRRVLHIREGSATCAEAEDY